MQFNSYIFILAFVPILIIGYYALNRWNIFAGKVYLIVASALFYAYAGWEVSLVLALSIIFNYIFALAIHRIDRYKKILLGLSVIGNVGILFYYKYLDFILSSVNGILETEFVMNEIILPLGISFFTFQQIMYLVNVYKGSIEKVQALDYLAYILYFPKIIMGPIVEPVDLISQINNPDLKRLNWDNMASGIKLFSFGLFKKLVFADTFAGAVAWGYNNIDITTSMDWFLIMLFYTFEIYFDFSGYSDMAVGVSTMLNIELPMNFNSPYKALSISDFWKRWHMTLTNFFTKYVYFPLGGSKKGNIRTYVNIMVIFLISGIWHGANWTFVLWGALHGLLKVFDRVFDKYQRKLSEVVRWSITFFEVNILWLLFRTDSITMWKDILVKMFSFQSMEVGSGLINSFVLPESQFLYKLLHMENLNASVRGLSMLLFLVASFAICLVPENNYKNRKENNIITMVMAAVAFVWSFLCLSSESVFVYFNF